MNRIVIPLFFLLLAGKLSSQPIIVTQPKDQTVILGSNATLSVLVAGTGPFNYQWRLNGTNLPNNIITTVAGNGSTNFAGDGGLAVNASLNQPQGVAFDAAGNLFIADNNNDRVRKVDGNGIITTVAGNGIGSNTNGGSYSGDGGMAINAGLFRPNNLAFDAVGNMYIADIFNNRIRKVDTNGIINTVAGTGTGGTTSDGGPAVNANLTYPASVAINANSDLFITELFLGCLRKVDANGTITTVAGNGSQYPGDGGMATNVVMSSPQGVAVDTNGNIYTAENYFPFPTQNYSRIRKIDTNGIIITIAGGGNKLASDGGPATNAWISQPWGVVLDPVGNMYIADRGFSTIRKVDTNGIITTVAGKLLKSGFSGDGGAATNANLYGPACVAFDQAGNLFIADWFNNRIRKVQLAGSPTITLINVDPASAGNYSVVITSPAGSVTSSIVTLKLQLPPITSEFIASNGLYSLTWDAVSNQVYQLQYVTNLAAADWVDLGSPITATSDSVSVTNRIVLDEQRYYRVRLLP